MNFLRELVSQDKIRYIDQDYNLDLTYITPRIIAMAYPAEGLESMFRNKIVDVSSFFKGKHQDNFLVINCSNRKYDYSYFNFQVHDMKWPNHYPCPFITYLDTVWVSLNYLIKKKDHVVSIHCLAGKGRTGSLICGLLYVSGKFKTMDEIIDYYLMKRAVTVTRPS